MSKNDIARPKIILDGKQAEEELDKLTQKANKYRDAMLAAASVGDNKAQKEAAANFKKATSEVNSFKREALSVESVLKNINGASFNEIAAASRKAAADLKKMKQIDPGYKQQQQDAQLLKTKMVELSRQSGVNVSGWEKLKTTAASLLPAFGFAAIAGAASFLFSKIVSGTDAMADQWEFAVSGMKNGLNYFYRTLSSGDWSNFFANMREAVKVGKEYAKMLDHAEDSTRALSMQESDARSEELKLELAIKNKTLSKADRLKAGEDRIKLEEDLSAKRTKIATEGLDAELLIAAQRTGLSKDQLISISKDIDSERKLEAEAYQEKIVRLQDLRSNNVTKVTESTTGHVSYASRPDTPEIKSLSKEIETTPDSIKQYSGTLNQYGNLTVDMMDRIAQAYAKKNEAENSAVENTKKVRNMVNSLLAGKEEDGNKIEDQAAKRRKEAADKAIEVLDNVQNERNTKILDQYEKEARSQEWFQEQQLAAEMAYLAQKKAILADLGQSTVDADNQIIAKRIEAQNKLAASQAEAYKIIADEAEKLSQDSDKADADSITETIDKVNEAIEGSRKLQEDQKNKEKQILEQRKEAYLNFATMVGGGLGDLMNNSEATFADYLKNILVMSLDALHQFFLLKKAEVLIDSAAGAATGRFWKIAGAVAAIVAMEAAYQGLRGALTSKNDKTAKHAAGGYAYEEQYIVSEENKPEWVAPNWMVTHPATAPLISNLEKMRETGNPVDITSLSRQNGTIAVPNTRAINEAMISRNYAPIEGRSFGYSNGRNDDRNPSEKSIIYQKHNELLDKIYAALDNNTRATALLMKRGVQFVSIRSTPSCFQRE